MQFTNSFSIPLPLDEAWDLILDIPAIMPCLPGAKLTGMQGDSVYQGEVAVRLGPVRLTFEGQAEIVDKDEENHIVYMKGSGTDPRGRGSAESNFDFQLKAVSDNQTDVVVNTELNLSGAVAQYGRGSGMISEVAGQILKNFEANLARLVEGGYHLQDEPEDTPVMGFDAASTAALGAGAVSAEGVAPTATDGARQQQPAHYTTDVSTAQAQALLAQSQALLAQTQALLLKTGLLGPAQKKEFKAAELNMFKVGLSAFWARLRYTFGKWFGKNRDE